MAKSQLYKGPMRYIYRNGGVFPVRRGHKDERAFEVAHAILGRGGTICMYCEGGRSRTGRISEKAKPGIGRVALESGAVIQPVAIHGSEKVRNWKRLQLPSVRVLYGEPMRFEPVDDPSREQQQAAADEIFAEIRRLYSELESGAASSASS
jgi:1-acyl-sn-glycerol-3-phosphate acyltransferase